jgi:ABC-type sugar transport system ATPase subunit
MDTTTDTFVVELRDIVKTFPGVRALDHVDFRLRPGEIHSLVGKNGAGKSTLMNILTGIYQPDGGQIWVGGERVETMTTAHAKQVGIAYVHQHSQLVPALSIAENIFCGNQPINGAGFVDWRVMNREAGERLDRVGLEIDPKRRVEGLSVAERQMIEIANAMFAEARVIILDEATAPLPKNEVDMLFSFIRRQRDQGVAFIYISHYLEEVFEVCDTVTVLRDGQLVGDYAVSDLDMPELIRHISGAKLERFKRERVELDGKPVLEIKGLSRPAAYYDVDLEFRAGEIVGLTGLEGCGKAMLARGLYGLEPLGEGEVTLEGEPYLAKMPDDALEKGVAYLPRDRHGLGIVGIRSVLENISLSILERLTNALGLLRPRTERGHVRHYVDTLGIITPGLRQPVEFLSGGNQQKVVFAKLAGTQPKVLLLDEPTQGVDVQAKVEIMKIVDEMSRQGVAVAFISEEIREMLDVCDRILVMYDGKVTTEFHMGDADATVEKILHAVEGG